MNRHIALYLGKDKHKPSVFFLVMDVNVEGAIAARGRELFPHTPGTGYWVLRTHGKVLQAGELRARYYEYYGCGNNDE